MISRKLMFDFWIWDISQKVLEAFSQCSVSEEKHKSYQRAPTSSTVNICICILWNLWHEYCELHHPGHSAGSRSPDPGADPPLLAPLDKWKVSEKEGRWDQQRLQWWRAREYWRGYRGWRHRLQSSIVYAAQIFCRRQSLQAFSSWMQNWRKGHRMNIWDNKWFFQYLQRRKIQLFKNWNVPRLATFVCCIGQNFSITASSSSKS